MIKAVRKSSVFSFTGAVSFSQKLAAPISLHRCGICAAGMRSSFVYDPSWLCTLPFLVYSGAKFRPVDKVSPHFGIYDRISVRRLFPACLKIGPLYCPSVRAGEHWLRCEGSHLCPAFAQSAFYKYDCALPPASMSGAVADGTHLLLSALAGWCRGCCRSISSRAGRGSGCVPW